LRMWLIGTARFRRSCPTYLHCEFGMRLWDLDDIPVVDVPVVFVVHIRPVGLHHQQDVSPHKQREA
jgi:hypothetical protein